MSQRLRADLALALTALIWGSAFAVQRVAARSFGFFTFNGLRFFLGAALVGAFAVWSSRRSLDQARGTSDRRLVLVAGAVLFLASALQQAGLEHTTAGNAGFFTSLYVVFVPFLLWLLQRQRVNGRVWLAVLLAAAGAGLLSTGGRGLRLAPGDGLELAGAVLWALHVLIVGRAAGRMDVLRFSAGQYLVAGLLNLVAGLAFEPAPLAGLASGWWTVVYIGVLSTALGYTLQAVGQRRAPPADAALLLSLEAVFAAITGWVFLGEAMSSVQMGGGAMILAGVLLAQVS